MGTKAHHPAAKVPRLPLNRDALALDSSPRSVQDARRWVVDACRELGRDDLAETAELGVSELVTNALLHAGPPIAVRLRGTYDHPRVEVFDASHEPPTSNPRMTDVDELLSTVGRGLGIVAMCSHAWGADLQPQGKVVWFEPATGLSESVEVEGDTFDWGTDTRRAASGRDLGDGIDIQFEGMPLPLYADFMRHYHELRRELRILALAHETDYPVAKRITDLFVRFDDELRRTRGVEELEAELEGDAQQIDIKFTVPRSSPATMSQMIELLELADAFCRNERLLSLATTPQQLSFQRWFLGEFVHQGSSQAPRAWAGGAQVQHYSQSAS